MRLLLHACAVDRTEQQRAAFAMKSFVASIITWLATCVVFCAAAGAQSDGLPPQTIAVRSNLVLVPVLVKSKAGGIVFSLTAQDFAVTDNGALQSARLEERSEAQRVAVAIVVQTGGAAAAHLEDYDGLDAVVDALIAGVPHQIAVVAFDSTPHLAQDFTTHAEAASASISALQPGDEKAAILDGIRYGIELLRKEPPNYHRALVLLSETVDAGSQSSFEDVVRGLNDTNIAVFSFGFSSTKAAVSHEATKPRRPDGSPYHGDAYRAGGCMSRDPDADPDAGGSRTYQAFDCATDLLPPLRLGRMAFAAATDSLKRNVPESVARMTGGEYFAFKNAKTLRQGMASISNDLPNYYILSFNPDSPTPGPHMLQVRLKDRPGLQLQARTIYWVASSATQ
jgi:VWFA-related protein